MNDDLQLLHQEVDALKQRELAMHFSFRVLARALAKRGGPDLQYLQAAIRRAADELDRNPEISDQVYSHMVNLSDNLLSDHFVLQGMDREAANSKVRQIQSSQDQGAG